MTLATEVVIILLLILVNGVFSMSEIAIVTVRRVRLQQRAAEGDRGAQAALELTSTPNRFLSTIQIGVTLVGVLTGALGGATLSRTLAAYLGGITWLASHASSVALALVVAAITFLTLVIGELVPKRLGLSNPEAVARYMSRPMRFLSVAIGPVVRLLSFTTDFSLKVLGVRAPSEPPVTEDEIRALIDEGTAAGVFHEAEQDMVESVLLLDDRRINALMTPRPEVVWLDLDDPADDLRRKITDSPYSRFPVGQGSLDRVLGEVQAKDMLIHVMEGKPFDLRPLLKRPLFVPETMPALKVLEAFKVSSTQMAMVVDEYGSVEGVVTLTDILEAIVGDIPSADEVAEPQAVQRGDGTWLVDGMLPIDEFKELLQIGELPGEDQGLYQSLGGFVTTRLEHVPSTGEHFAWAGWTYEVMDMDGTRVDKVLMMPEGAASEGQPGTTEE